MLKVVGILTFMTIVGILTFMSRINFVLSRVEYEKSFITSGPGFHSKFGLEFVSHEDLSLDLIFRSVEA